MSGAVQLRDICFARAKGRAWPVPEVRHRPTVEHPDLAANLRSRPRAAISFAASVSLRMLVATGRRDAWDRALNCNSCALGGGAVRRYLPDAGVLERTCCTAGAAVCV